MCVASAPTCWEPPAAHAIARPSTPYTHAVPREGAGDALEIGRETRRTRRTPPRIDAQGANAGVCAPVAIAKHVVSSTMSRSVSPRLTPRSAGGKRAAPVKKLSSAGDR